MFDPELRDHLLIMKRYLPLILGGALLIGALTYLLQNQATPIYEASATVQLEIDVVDDGLITDFQSAQFAQIMGSTDKLDEIAQQAGLGPLGVDAVRDRLVVDQRDVPGFIDLIAVGPSGEEAASLANVAAAVLQDTIATSRLATAPGSETSGRILGLAEVPSNPNSPRPKRDAALAGLVSLIVLAEASVLFTKIRGRVSLADPAGNVQRATNVATFTIDDEDHYNQAVMPLFVNSLAQQPSVVVVQRGAVPSTAVASQIGNAASLVGRNVALIDGNLSSAQFISLDPAADFTVASVTAVSNESEALLAVSRLPYSVVLVVDPNSMSLSDIESLARTIPGVGGNLVGIILNEPSGLAPKLTAAFKKSEPAVRRPSVETTNPVADMSPEVAATMAPPLVSPHDAPFAPPSA